MANLSITEVWNETADFVRREARLLFPIAFLLVALPGSVLQLFMPQPAAPAELPEAGLWLLFLPLAAVLAMIGTIALNYLALRPGASVGEALQRGGRRFIFLFAASLLVALAAALALVPLLILVGGLAAAAGGGASATPAAAFALVLVMLVAMLALWVRLLLMTPVAAVEEGGPIGIIRRSWDLTRGHFWRLFAFAVLVLVAASIAMGVITLLVGIVVALFAGPPDPLTLSAILMALVTALLQALFTMIFATLIARIYAQLTGSPASDVFA